MSLEVMRNETILPPVTFTYGAVLKIEREHSREDIRRMLWDMKQAGFNTAVIWPAVCWWEQETPRYPYDTGCHILEYAGTIGMKIIMELAGQITALEYIPDFLMKDEYYCVDQKGNRDYTGLGYGYLNFNHPEVIGLLQKQYREAAEKYMVYPALYGYDIWNETQFTSFDDYTLRRFRVWLKQKYESLEQLNDSWDRVYHSWEQVKFTPWMWASVMAFVDYQAFHKDNIGLILADMKAAIYKVDRAHPILADNIHSTVTMDKYYDRPTNDWVVAQNVDHYGISFYPKFLSRFTPPYKRHQVMAGAHSASPDGTFSISEMQTHHATMFNPEGSVMPEELWQWCWEAVAHGAKGLIYWKWNPFAKGVQTFGRGLVNHKGEAGERLKTAQAVWNVISSDSAFTTCRPVRISAAILYDRLNQDFSKAYTMGFQGALGAPDSLYIDSIGGLYQALWSQNIPTKFITPEQLENLDCKEHPVLFITTQITMDNQMAQALLSYTEQGGRCVFDGKMAEINERGILCHQIPGGGLSEALGFELLDIESGDLEITVDMDEEVIPVMGGHDRRQINPDGLTAQVIGTYSDGSPAVLTQQYGKGEIYYLSTFFWMECGKQMMADALKLTRLLVAGCFQNQVTCSQPEIHWELLEGDEETLLFAFNYCGRPLEADFSMKVSDISHVYELTEGKEIPSAFSDGQLVFSDHVKANGVLIYKVGERV